MTKKSAISLAVLLVVVGFIVMTLFDRNDSANVVDDVVEHETPDFADSPSLHESYSIRWRDAELQLEDHSDLHNQEIRLAVSELLRQALSADASVSTDAVDVRAIVADKEQWQAQLAIARETLGDSVALTPDVIFIDTENDAAQICGQAFPTLDIGPINFVESGIEFRNSAYPQLERLAAFALACPDVDVMITGHTDSTGDPGWNQTLSELRAAAVGDFIAARGVDPMRLVISGAGATRPLVDNATRYGRGKNRRIEINFRPTPATSEQ